MAQRWLSVMDAARELGVHPSQVRHDIIAGNVISRFDECGRQVLVGEPDAAPQPGQNHMQGWLGRWTWVSWMIAGILALLASIVYGMGGGGN